MSHCNAIVAVATDLFLVPAGVVCVVSFRQMAVLIGVILVEASMLLLLVRLMHFHGIHCCCHDFWMLSRRLDIAISIAVVVKHLTIPASLLASILVAELRLLILLLSTTREEILSRLFVTIVRPCIIVIIDVLLSISLLFSDYSTCGGKWVAFLAASRRKIVIEGRWACVQIK